MPAGHPSANKFRNLLMHQAAERGQMISLRCGLCNRVANYWASDLIAVVGPNHEAHVSPFDCAQCKTREYIDVTCAVPSPSKLNSLTVRRPVKQVTKWIWRDEKA